MGNFDERYSTNQNFNEESLEYYEDTHYDDQSYTQRLKEFTASRNNSTKFVGREDTFNPRPNNIVNDSVKEEKVEEEIENITEEIKEEEKDREISFKKITVYQPKVEKEAENIIRKLKTGEPVVIDMTDCEDATAQRVLDFVSGASFALDGVMKRVSKSVFLAVPPKVKVIIEEDE